MDSFTKQVNEKITFSIDFSNSLVDTELISTYTVTAYSESIDCTDTVIDNYDNTTTTVSIRTKGGTNGNKYKITVLITTDQNNVYEKDILMKVCEV